MSENENNPFGKMEDDPFANLGTEPELGSNTFGELGNDAPDSDPLGLGANDNIPGLDNTPAGMDPAVSDPANLDEPLLKGKKKGKKFKAPKASKSPKRKKEHRRIKPEHVPRLPGDIWIQLSLLAALAVLVVGDVFAYMWYNMEAVNFLIIYSILGVFLVLIPILLWRRRSYGNVVNLYQVMLACSLALLILACMLVLIAQSVRYGTNYKGNLTGRAEVQQIDRFV